MATAKTQQSQPGLFDNPETREALKALIKEVLNEVLQDHQSLRPPTPPPLKDPLLKTPGLKTHPKLNGKSGGGLREEVRNVLIESGMDLNWVRLFDTWPCYTNILNNPYSGDVKDCVFLAKKFAKKDTFPQTLANFLKKLPSSDPSEVLDKVYKEDMLEEPAKPLFETPKPEPKKKSTPKYKSKQPETLGPKPEGKHPSHSWQVVRAPNGLWWSCEKCHLNGDHPMAIDSCSPMNIDI